MAVYITGDTRGTEDLEKINTDNFPEQRFMNPDNDYLIITGDLEACGVFRKQMRIS